MITSVLLLLFSSLCPSSDALLVPPPSSPGPASRNATSDELALLSFKSMLSEGSLTSWNTSTHFCRWPGVACSRGQRKAVVSVRLGSSSLSGRISPYLGNLSFLAELDLGDNQLVGRIPPELGRLSRLRSLNLSFNSLQGTIPVAIAAGCTNLTTFVLARNSLRGTIPFQIGTNLRKLTVLDLQRNNLSGEIPPSLTQLQSMQFLSLRYNQLSGEIPAALGNLTGLRELYLNYNSLSGAIPSSLGQPPNFSYLNLESNQLTGVIPASIWNLSSLVVFSVMYNMLSGTIPPNAFAALPHIHQILVNNNQFHGPFPASIGNASSVSLVQVDNNLFSGVVPRGLGRLGNLNFLLLQLNLFEANDPKDWEFITDLTNCSQLEELGLAGNRFAGVLPYSLSNLSTTLYDLEFGSNKIRGNIPRDISNLVNLLNLDFSENFFTGSLPSSLGSLQNLASFYALQNNLTGPIPLTIGNLTELTRLRLDMNSFSGRIPSTLGNLSKLLLLDLSANGFTGPIPETLFSIQTLSIVLDVSYNSLEGSIPQEIGNLKNLVELHLESNKLSGEIPASVGECRLLQNLYLQNNSLNGSIPPTLNQLAGLETLDLSSNSLSGKIPNFFGNITMLRYLNLSFNGFVGEVPTVGVFTNATAVSIKGNAKLCGGIPTLHLPPCSLQSSSRKHKLIVVPIVISLVATIVVLASLYKISMCHKKNKRKIPSSTTMQTHPMISYSQLVKATNGFSTTNLLGSGSFGIVYKGELDGEEDETENLVAVKVLKLQTPKALKSFTAECEALRNMRHRNLVKIATICSSIDTRGDDFKAIVYEFMPNGNLEGWLHPETNDQTEQQQLDLRLRVTILLDVACALDYLHCHGPAPVVHCDVKSSNVLLDADMVAHVGDFGLARILVDGNSLLQQSTSSAGLMGTIGYAAPEYGAGNMVSTAGDIYSYGILVLETVTGKRPTDTIFRQGQRLREYVEQALDYSVMEFIDTRVANELQTMDDFSRRKVKIDCLMSLLRLGMCCSHETPSSRMLTGDIVKELHTIKESLT